MTTLIIEVYDNFIADETESYESVKSRNRFTCFAKDRGMYSPDNLHDSVLKLHKYCLTHLLDSYRVHLNRLKGKEGLKIFYWNFYHSTIWVVLQIYFVSDVLFHIDFEVNIIRKLLRICRICTSCDVAMLFSSLWLCFSMPIAPNVCTLLLSTIDLFYPCLFICLDVYTVRPSSIILLCFLYLIEYRFNFFIHS